MNEPWNPQSAREAGLKSAAKRAERKPPQEIFQEAQSELANELVKAAMGRGKFSDLAPGQRLNAIIKALEFGIGRPAAQKAAEEKRHVPTPESIFSSE